MLTFTEDFAKTTDWEKAAALTLVTGQESPILGKRTTALFLRNWFEHLDTIVLDKIVNTDTNG